MSIDRIMTEPEPDASVEVEVEIEPTADVEVTFGEDEVEVDVFDHNTNFADVLDDIALAKIASDVCDAYEQDKSSRSEWVEAYTKGLDLLGMNMEEKTQPWSGASGVYHPIMTECVIRFQAEAMSEIYPASGPARTKVFGKRTQDKMDRANRIETELNYQTTENIEDYRDELEALLFRLPIAGSAFKKIYFDPTLERPAAMFVPAEDLVVSYGATDLRTAERYTHVMRKSRDEVEELQATGFYRDVDLPAPDVVYSDVQEKYDELTGSTSPGASHDERHTLLEQHVMMRLPAPYGDEDAPAEPYVVTVDYSSQEVLSIRRNWLEGDGRKKKRMHFVHYRYLPGMGFYGTGLIHLIGGLAHTATQTLRQLLDAGTLANLPAGVKTRGFRIKGDNTPFRPGEFRDVDIASGTIRDNITFLPYKEPSATLYNLLQNVVEEARRIGSVVDMAGLQQSGEQPVGTTFALLEQQLKVLSGVQSRVHAAMKKELRLLADVIRDFMNGEYDWDEDHDRREDFRSSVVIQPVSDPNAATKAQRIVAYQAAMQLSQNAPQLYNMGKLHRQFLETLDIENAEDIIQLPEDVKPRDPTAENMAILKQEPVKAFLYQDHEAHIQVHMAAMQDPKINQIVGQSPFAGAIQSAAAAHITEHIAMEYRRRIVTELGVSLPDPEEPMPEDVEREVSRLAAQAADRLLQRHVSEQKAEENRAEQEDPLNIIQREELRLKEKEIDLDHEINRIKVELERQRMLRSDVMQERRMESDEAKKAADLSVKLATEQTGAQKIGMEALKMATDLTKDLVNEPVRNDRDRTE